MILETDTDVEYTVFIDYKRSPSGYYTFLGGNLVTWRSKNQNAVPRSSAEAKF